MLINCLIYRPYFVRHRSLANKLLDAQSPKGRDTMVSNGDYIEECVVQ